MCIYPRTSFGSFFFGGISRRPSKKVPSRRIGGQARGKRKMVGESGWFRLVWLVWFGWLFFCVLGGWVMVVLCFFFDICRLTMPLALLKAGLLFIRFLSANPRKSMSDF